MATYYFLEPSGIGFENPTFSKPQVNLPDDVETRMEININMEMTVAGMVGVIPVSLYNVAVINLLYDKDDLQLRIQEHLDLYHTQPL
jgi:hypothetical protein